MYVQYNFLSFDNVEFLVDNNNNNKSYLENWQLKVKWNVTNVIGDFIVYNLLKQLFL